MASMNTRKELTCSICLNLYTDPVSLRCGHNFCRSCIVQVLDTQDGSGGYSCPDCRAEYPERPALEKNRKLGNIVECILSDMEGRIFCTYCKESSVPAVKSCLQCEISLCDDHLKDHNKAMDHKLMEPTNFFKDLKCPVHKNILEYYCLQDEVCLCGSCIVVEMHKGHQVEHLEEASEKEKEKLRKYLDELHPQKSDVQTRLQNLQEHDKRNVQEKASDKRENVSKTFMDIKEQLEMAEKKALSEISRQEEKIVSQIPALIRKLEINEDELSRKMCHLEEMCHVTDPLRFLQGRPLTVCGHGDGENTGGDGGKIKSTDDLDEVLISLTLHRSLRDIITNVTSQQCNIHVPDILLDVDTAHRNLKISEDLKTSTESEEQNRPESPRRFLDFPQVLSRCGLSSGRHYWEVKWNQIGSCDIGMSYPSIEREQQQSGIGYNAKSWCLFVKKDLFKASHNSDYTILKLEPTYPTFGVFLDYEAGRLSFYELCDPIRHLHTFSASFTEPLYAALCVCDGASLTI